MQASTALSDLPGGAVRLSDWGVIRATGPDARSFLHGQLTQDVAQMKPGSARLAGYCSAKGRLLASFVVWARSDDEILLACSADLLAETVKRLSMFVLRAKCKLSDAGAEIALWGLAGDAAGAWLGTLAAQQVWQCAAAGAGQCIRLPDAGAPGSATMRWLLALPVAESAPPIAPIAPTAWNALEARSGVARIVAATREQFVPQMLNLELVGGVNFQKGCYPGQEVVARSQYRGTLKRRAFLLSCEVPMLPGQEVFHSDDPSQPAGMVALGGALSHGPYEALVELKLQAAAGGQLHLGAADGPLLRMGRLPYEIPLEPA